ncbi:hypothetical protein HC256_006775 [Beauveria bassiana]|nr:hypothetical protein HC256_006775 [Beauveria bassiana]
MEACATAERPYRSHLQPACIPCRRRKSRCQTEANSSACLMCKLHKSNCRYPDSPRKDPADRPDDDGQRLSTHRSNRHRSGATTKQPRATTAPRRSSRRRANTRSTDATPSQTSAPLQRGISAQSLEELPSLDAADGENLHIVGPAATDDSRVLTDYLAGVPGAQRRIRMVLSASLSKSKPVLFTAVQKRPLGIAPHQSPAAEKLEIIEKLLELRLDDMIET